MRLKDADFEPTMDIGARQFPSLPEQFIRPMKPGEERRPGEYVAPPLPPETEPSPFNEYGEYGSPVDVATTTVRDYMSPLPQAEELTDIWSEKSVMDPESQAAMGNRFLRSISPSILGILAISDVIPAGFYSKMAKVLETALPKKATAKEFAEKINNLAAKGKFKMEEMKDLDMLGFLKSKGDALMTREDVFSYMAEKYPSISTNRLSYDDLDIYNEHSIRKMFRSPDSVEYLDEIDSLIKREFPDSTVLDKTFLIDENGLPAVNVKTDKEFINIYGDYDGGKAIPKVDDAFGYQSDGSWAEDYSMVELIRRSSDSDYTRPGYGEYSYGKLENPAKAQKYDYREDVTVLEGSGYVGDHFDTMEGVLFHTRGQLRHDRNTGETFHVMDEVQSDLHQQLDDLEKKGKIVIDSIDLADSEHLQSLDMMTRRGGSAKQQFDEALKDYEFKKVAEQYETNLGGRAQRYELLRGDGSIVGTYYLSPDYEYPFSNPRVRQDAIKDMYRRGKLDIDMDEFRAGMKNPNIVESMTGLKSIPFRKSWDRLGVAQEIKVAVDNRADYFTWAHGDEQIRRYPGLTNRQKEGQKKFYDEKMPILVRDLMAPYGKPEIVKVKLPDSEDWAWGFKITPEMRSKMEKAVREGPGMFPVYGAAVGGAGLASMDYQESRDDTGQTAGTGSGLGRLFLNRKTEEEVDGR